MSALEPLRCQELRGQFRNGLPFPFILVDNFLEREFALAVAAAYPSYAEGRTLGREFNALNEKLKVQITEPSLFPEPVAELNRALANESFLGDLGYITGVPKLLADPVLVGGGMHLTGPRGRLDVHVDFNYLSEQKLHRRLNLLLYLNPAWQPEWGGQLELWNRDVSRCCHSIDPVFNRCLIFETSDISYHGVAPVRCPADCIRQSFAAYYYTKAAPASWDGTEHNTVFRGRPEERLRKYLLMPAVELRDSIVERARQAKRAVRSLLR